MKNLFALRRRWLLPLNRFLLELNSRFHRKFLAKIDASSIIAIALLLLGGMLYYDLGGGDMQDWDEAMYAWRAKSIVYFGGATWLDQTKYSFPADHVWLDKKTGEPVPGQELYSGSFPPLLVWLMALLFEFFGANNFSARFWPALTGAGTIVCVYFSLKHLTRNRAAALGGAALTGTAPLLCEYAQKAQFDVPMIFFIALTCTAYIVWHATRNPRWLAFCGCGLGLGLMTKIALPYFAAVFIGLTGMYWLYACAGKIPRLIFLAALAIALIALPLSKGVFAAIVLALFAGAFFADLRAALRFTREMLAIHLLAGAIFLPWHLFMCWRHGMLFPRWYVVYHLIERSSGTLESHQGGKFYYVQQLWEYLPAPAIALMLSGMIFGAIALLRENGEYAPSAISAYPAIDWQRHGAKYILPILMLLLPLLLFSAAQTKREPYTLLLFTPYGLLAGLALARLLQLKRREAGLMLLTLTLVALLFFIDRDRSAMRDFVKDVLYKGAERSLLYNALTACRIYLPLALSAAGIACGIIFIFGGGRGGRMIALLLILCVTAIFAGRKYNRHFLAGKGHHNFGWSIIAPHVDDRRSYDVLIFAGGWSAPSTVYYFDGQAGLAKSYDVHGRKFIQLLKGMDPAAIAKIIPPDQRVLLICEREYLRLNFSAESVRALLADFTITPESREILPGGEYPWLQVWRRPARLAAQ